MLFAEEIEIAHDEGDQGNIKMSHVGEAYGYDSTSNYASFIAVFVSLLVLAGTVDFEGLYSIF
jgi:hypothetical protein